MNRRLVAAEVRQQRGLLLCALGAALTWLSMRQTVAMSLPLWVDWTRGTMYALLQLPAVAVFVGVWTGGRDRATGVAEFRARAQRPDTRTQLLSLAVSTGSLLLGWAIAVVVRALQYATAGATGADGVNLAALVVATAWVIAAGAMGHAVGVLARPRWVVAPLLAAGVFVVPLAITFVSPELESVTPIPWDIWQAQGRWDATQVLGTTTLAVAAAVLGAAAYWLSHRRSRIPIVALAMSVASSVPVAAALAGGTSWRPMPDDGELRPVGELACVPSGRHQLCTHPAHAALLESVPTELGEPTDEPTTVRFDIGLGNTPRELPDGSVGIGLDVTNRVASIPVCAVEAIIAAGGNVASTSPGPPPPAESC